MRRHKNRYNNNNNALDFVLPQEHVRNAFADGKPAATFGTLQLSFHHLHLTHTHTPSHTHTHHHHHTHTITHTHTPSHTHHHHHTHTITHTHTHTITHTPSPSHTHTHHHTHTHKYHASNVAPLPNSMSLNVPRALHDEQFSRSDCWSHIHLEQHRVQSQLLPPQHTHTRREWGI